ncbi:hypothetical protein [Streptomyces sp. AC602_WCS936]|uniref:hypothetical protein n=1 Tax=Streptomyces sp. AC602_WCS936 TaxID=2823685 RepID=UPI001C263C83|nr:hypothetical protein [Streptomyces sp. AC602_WCS936]
MAWAYAELAKEAAKRGGPTALRAFYTGRGIIIGGAVTSAPIAGTVAYDKWSKRRTAGSSRTVNPSRPSLVPGQRPNWNRLFTNFYTLGSQPPGQEGRALR